jgi:hypothetical protein
MHRITFTIGQGKDKDGKLLAESIYDLGIRRRTAGKRIAEVFGGYTLTIVSGGWLDGCGDLIEEESIILMAICTDEHRLASVPSLGVYLREAFNQEYVLVTVEEISAKFI